jgi:hypothetical protein
MVRYGVRCTVDVDLTAARENRRMSVEEGWISVWILRYIVYAAEEKARCGTTSTWECRARDAAFLRSTPLVTDPPLEYPGPATPISFREGARRRDCDPSPLGVSSTICEEGRGRLAGSACKW